MRTKSFSVESPLSRREEEIAREIVSCAYCIHTELGPGLLEHIYEVCFCHELIKRGLPVQRQVPMSLTYDGIVFEEAFKIDVLVGELVICELKAVEKLSPVHSAQLLTYMKFSEKRLGFLLNFNTDLIKHGIKRMVLTQN